MHGNKLHDVLFIRVLVRATAWRAAVAGRNQNHDAPLTHHGDHKLVAARTRVKVRIARLVEHHVLYLYLVIERRHFAAGPDGSASVRCQSDAIRVESEICRRSVEGVKVHEGVPLRGLAQKWERQISESRSDDLTPESETLLFRRGSRGTRPDGRTLCSQNPTFTLYFSQCPKFRLSSLTTALVRLVLRLSALFPLFHLPCALHFSPRRAFPPPRVFLFHLITAHSLRAL